MKLKEINQIFSPLKLVNQSMLNKAHIIEITKAYTVVFMKAKSSLVACCREREKTKYGENVFFKALANFERLLTSICVNFEKSFIVHRRPSIKWTS